MVNKPIEQIQFHYLHHNFSFKNRIALKGFISRMVSEEGRQIDRISIIFCSDDYLLEINKSYLSHNYYTDIITFSLASKEEPLVSDIYISIDRVRENAKEFASSFTWELHRVIFHGILHLCGYEDKIVSQSKKMRRLEDWYLGEYFVSREIDRI